MYDGAMGTMIQKHKLDEPDFRAERDYDMLIKGNNDLLSITQPHIIRDIYKKYLVEGGSQLIGTNTFSSTTIAQADYKMEDLVYELNYDSASRLREAYYEQCVGLADGGCDIFIIETIFDTLNAKAACFAVNEFLEHTGIDIPLFISGTLVDQSGRTLSGQTGEAFYVSIRHAKPMCVGLNCALGAKAMAPFLKRLSDCAECFVHVYSNAGLPNAMGGYDDTPADMAGENVVFAESGWVNMIGGCCGSTPPHIKAIWEACKDFKPRALPTLGCPRLWLSGLEDFRHDETTYNNCGLPFVNVGERCNIAGSRKFKRLIMEGKYPELMDIARTRSRPGAVIDINADDGMLDGLAAMQKFVKMAVTEPDGKCIVNSISLKVGEELFVKHATLLRKHGAAVVVMAFDEYGQAATKEDKVRICKRSYDILVNEPVCFPPEDIIFDPNILTIGTGIEEHNAYGVDFIEAVAQIKEICPWCKISGGVSNLSFGFRGVNVIRESIHAFFLYHAALQSGMDMGIVNAAEMLAINEATEAEKEAAEARKNGGAVAVAKKTTWRDLPIGGGSRALVKGISEFVIKSARVMKKAVAHLLPFMEAEKREKLIAEGKDPDAQDDDSAYAGKFLIATVKGDVHDIGKNIVAVVLGCNNYKRADHPSLDEMVDAAKEMSGGFKVPLLIGGATTSKMHTAVKVAPCYASDEHPVIHVLDASRAVTVVSNLLNENEKPDYVADISDEYAELRDEYYASLEDRKFLDLPKAKSKKQVLDWAKVAPKPKCELGSHAVEYALEDVLPFIDWNPFFQTWELRGRYPNRGYPKIFNDETVGGEAKKLFDDAQAMLADIVTRKRLVLRGCYGMYAANQSADGEDVDQAEVEGQAHYHSQGDFIAPRGVEDYLGMFAVACFGADKCAKEYEARAATTARS
ncbi:betaine-homocysteine S-methyltransferase [Aureococcus anophagefferens]|nr:betaine-homocysteine S-methyltransferase [Aureococcus anophagefferens]